MMRLRLFGRCRIYHDPVTPILRSPAQIGWDAWFRSIDLVTPHRLKGEELLRKTKGWWTVDPEQIAEVIAPYGKVVIGDQGELMVECIDEATINALSEALRKTFGEQVQLAP
jgi:hypothetical protein